MFRKNTMKHYIPTKFAKIEDLLSYNAGRNVKQYHRFGKQVMSCKVKHTPDI